MEELDRSILKKAFRILRRNYGCPGNDGISILEVRKNYRIYEAGILKAIKKVDFNFEANPKEVLILDYQGKKRKIFVYSVLERWLQEFIKLHIEPIIEDNLSEYTYAFRQRKSDVDSYNYILSNQPEYILRLDIQNFFNSINKDGIYSELDCLGVRKSWIELIEGCFRHHLFGLPQGNVLSCMLSNLSLSNFDRLFPSNFARYSDDMMFACYSRQEVNDTLKFATENLASLGFSLNKFKTRVVAEPTYEKLK